MRRPSQIRYISIGPGPGSNQAGLLTRIVAFVVGIVVLAAAVFVGAIFIAGIVGLVLFVSLAAAARLWWLRRQAERYQQEHGDIDAEYTVVNETRKRDEH
jgi:Flp pilus assembly protein TadB